MKMKQLTVAMITLLLTASCSEKQQDYPFRNPDLPLEERIDDLLSRLTPDFFMNLYHFSYIFTVLLPVRG